MDIRVVVYQSLTDFIYYIEMEFSVTSNFDILYSGAKNKSDKPYFM